MARIVFLSNQTISPSEVHQTGAGGIQTGTVRLAEAFKRKGHDVVVYSQGSQTEVYHEVYYYPLDQAKRLEADLIISNNTAALFKRVSSGKMVVWQRNRTSFSRAYRRNELFTLFVKRPDIVTLSYDALKKTPKLLPYRNRYVIQHAVDDAFFLHSDRSFKERNCQAFFASRPSRNLSFVIEAWKNVVTKKVPEAKLYICMPSSAKFKFDKEELEKHNILFLGSIPKLELDDLMSKSRVLPYPGHINETGCQVALQAITSGTPIVTQGLGSLIDIVTDNENGFIEKDMQGYGEKIVTCLTNEDAWTSLHKNTFNHPWRKTYDQKIEEWEALLLS